MQVKQVISVYLKPIKPSSRHAYEWSVTRVIVDARESGESARVHGDVGEGFWIYCDLDDRSILRAKKTLLRKFEAGVAGIIGSIARMREQLDAEEDL